MDLPLHHSLTVEQLNRSIDAETNPETLRQICRILLGAWVTQQSMTQFVIQDSLRRAHAFRGDHPRHPSATGQ